MLFLISARRRTHERFQEPFPAGSGTFFGHRGILFSRGAIRKHVLDSPRSRAIFRVALAPPVLSLPSPCGQWLDSFTICGAYPSSGSDRQSTLARPVPPSPGRCSARGLVHFSVSAACYSRRASSENMCLTPSRRTLHSRRAPQRSGKKSGRDSPVRDRSVLVLTAK